MTALINLTIVLFTISTLALMAACVIAANRMSGYTGRWLKAAMILVTLGAGAQWMLAGYHLVPAWCMLCCIPISLGVSGILIWNRRRYDEPMGAGR